MGITSQHPAIPTLNRMRIVSLLLFVAATCLARHHRFKTHRRSHTVQRDEVELIPVQEEKGTKDDKDDDQYDAGRDWYDEEFFREYLAEMDELELYDDKEIGREYPVEKDKSEWYDDEETDYDDKEDTYSEDIERDYANKEDNQESEW